MMVTMVRSAPHHQRHSRRQQRSQQWEAQSAGIDQQHEKNFWRNPCRYTMPTTKPTNGSMENKRGFTPAQLQSLKDALPILIHRLDTLPSNAIDTSDLSQWFQKYNSTYTFLHRIKLNTTHSIALLKWHNETQVYVGAFEYLYNKARRIDKSNNEGREKSDELKSLLVLSRNLLCEIETVINSKTGQPIVNVWTESAMEKRLQKFQNNNSHNIDRLDVDDMDNKFTKLRFAEYLHNMQSAILSRPMKKNMTGRAGGGRRNKLRKGRKGAANKHRLGGGGGGGGGRAAQRLREKEAAAAGSKLVAATKKNKNHAMKKLRKLKKPKNVLLVPQQQ